MKNVLVVYCLTILICSSSIFGQFVTNMSGCISPNPDNCPEYIYYGQAPFPYDVLPRFVTIQPYWTGSDTMYISGEAIISMSFGCDMFTLVIYWDLVVTYISACDNCPLDNVGDVNFDGVITVEDIVYLQEYISGAGPAPQILGYADVNGDCILDTFDLQVLDEFVNNMGPALADCACADVDTCSFQTPGDVNNNLYIEIADVVYLENYLIGLNPQPLILSNADVNGDCIVNMDDVDYLLDYLQYGLDAPVDCTCISPIVYLTCCEGITGNVDNDINEEINIGDIVALVDLMFGDPNNFVFCYEEANINGLGMVDIADLVYLVDYSFGVPSGSPPTECPEL